jgi:hypothetical protein
MNRFRPKAKRYVVLPDGQEVADTKTGLIWRRYAEGITFNDNACTGNFNLYTFDEALSWAAQEAAKTSKNWRLPDLSELADIVECGRVSPFIDTDVFPATPAYYFWSSSFNSFDYAWSINFDNSFLCHEKRNSTFALRLVRDSGNLFIA